jgi:hypothetical protein
VALQPTEEWKSGVVRLVVLADGVEAGEAGFGHNLLKASFDPAGPIAPGEELEVTGTLEQLNSSAGSSEDAGVPGAFTLEVGLPTGEVVHSARVRAASDGTFSAFVPEAATVDVAAGPDRDFTTTLGVRAVNAEHTDDSTGTWKAKQAGAGTVKVVNAPNSLQVHNSFVSSVGWVKPGDSYPSRVTVTNATDRDWSGVSVTVPAPDGTTFTQARPGASAGSGGPRAGVEEPLLHRHAAPRRRGPGGDLREPWPARRPAVAGVRHREVWRPALPGRPRGLPGPQAPVLQLR